MSQVHNISLFECAVQYDALSKKQKKIVLAFLYYYEKRLLGDHRETYPSEFIIAKIAGCARSTVCKFLKECFDFFFTSITQMRDTFQKTFYKNVYEFQSVMFDFLLKIKHMGFLTDWKKHRLKILDMYCPDKEKFREKISQVVYENDAKIGHGSASKSDTIKDSIKDIDTYKKNVSISDENKRKAYGILIGEGLSHEEAMKLSKFYSLESIFETRQRAHWYKKHKEIKNLPAFFWSMCKRICSKN